MRFVELANKTFSVATVVGQLLAVVLLILLISRRKSAALDFLGRNFLILSFLASLSAAVGSLIYSNIIGYAPCELCWLQRIFMYSQVVILAVALAKKDKRAADYLIALSAIGAVVAAYHYLLQMGIVPSIICSAIGTSSQCARIYIFEFGYITMPMMSLTIFLLIAIMAIIGKRYTEKVGT